MSKKSTLAKRKNTLTTCLAVVLVGITASGCVGIGKSKDAALLHARIEQSGVVQCFTGDLTQENGKPATCELSAVAYVDGKLLFANDKPIPGAGHSPVFSMGFPGNRLSVNESPDYLTAKPFVDATKYEAMTVTNDGWVIASTAFDRYSKDKPADDRYNTLLYWQASNPEHVRVVGEDSGKANASSIEIRAKILQALNLPEGQEYFKVEGIAVLPGNKLLFGIRENGKSYKDFKYAIKLVEADYSMTDNRLILNNQFKLVYDFTPPQELGLHHDLGLSSIEYDTTAQRLYMLTSFEEGEKPEDIGAYLWILPLAGLQENKPATLITDQYSKPFSFSHKAEGLAILDSTHIFVITDDDRVIKTVNESDDDQQRVRKLSEAAYNIVEIK